MMFILMLRITFELLQEPMRFVLLCQAGLVELLFIFADQCLNVNKSPNLICSSYKEIESSEKSYGFVLRSLYERFDASNW